MEKLKSNRMVGNKLPTIVETIRLQYIGVSRDLRDALDGGGCEQTANTDIWSSH